MTVSASAASPPPSPDPDVPAGVTAGVAVFDRSTGRFTELLDEERQFRSASVVKLLLALDVLWDLGPDHRVPAEDQARLEAMLRSSDDGEASHYWSQRGGSRIIERMAARLGLTGTAPPPATHPGFWGYTALTASDTVRIYRYLLDRAPAPVRDVVMGSLRRSTRCANDGYDQYFGIPSAFTGPWAVKQGWSGFASGGCTADGEAPAPAAPASVHGARPHGASTAGRPPAAVDGGGVDLAGGALHSTGTVGPDDRSIVAVLTLHPDGTPYGTAYSRLTRLVDSLDVPGARRPSGVRFATLGSGVRVRAGATTDSAVVTTLPAGVEVLVTCQKRGQPITVAARSSDWWAHVPQYGGYLTNVLVDTPEDRLPDIPVC
ncbi:SH3 domain-containing protein [Streptomyces sp. NPDC052701]|uniref:SH3 domain-containing protein n=1 Tax=Streptomyces sp. NPDC052701 TaxID=3155533 RepID=UPI00342A31BD